MSKILGVEVCDLTLERIVPLIIKLIKTPGKKALFCANPQSINLYQTNKEFRKAINHAYLLYPEGTGVFLASKILDKKGLSGRTNFLDFIFPVLEYAERKKWALYVLGGRETVLRAFIKTINKKFPNLLVAGHNGYFSKEDEVEIIEEMNKIKPKIVFVALGMPAQVIWINKHMKDIEASVFFGIGGAIDIIAGRLSRAPKFLRKLGLEWAYRMYKEPVRLSGRYILGNVLFVGRVVKGALSR